MAIRKVKKEMAVDATPVAITFEAIREYHKDGALRGFWVESTEYQDLYLNYNSKNPENNFQLDNLAKQLGLEEYDDEKVPEYFNVKAGTKVTASRVTREEFTNTVFGARATASEMPF